MKSITKMLLTACGGLLALPASATNFTVLNAPNSIQTALMGINNIGQIVGYTTKTCRCKVL